MSTFPTEASINVTAATDTQLKVNSSDLRSPVALSESVFVSQGCSLPDQRSVERITAEIQLHHILLQIPGLSKRFHMAGALIRIFPKNTETLRGVILFD